VLTAAAEALTRGDRVALVTVVRARGSTPQRAGAKMLVFADGRTVGTIGGGCYENDAFWKAREAIASGKSSLVHYELNDDFAQENGLVCGGQMDVHIDPLEPTPDLYVIGAGHVGWYVGRMAADAGFRIHVIDDREKFANASRMRCAPNPSLPGCTRRSFPHQRSSWWSRAVTHMTSRRCVRWQRATCATWG
jgi:xanthine dehydrogenase accessory factor